jgi:regulator of RNase E activity RraA
MTKNVGDETSAMNRHSGEYFDWIEARLYTAVLADVMDDLGWRNQVMRYTIRPLYPEARIVGRAATMHAIETTAMPAEPYKLEMELLDDLKPGEVVLCAMGGSAAASIWGELLSTCAQSRGGRGAIIDGCTRDALGIIEMRFPVFSIGMMTADSKGRFDIVAIRQAVDMGGVLVQDGDLVMADYDGCVAVPQAIEATVIARAMQKVNGENRVREELLNGASIVSVFKEYGIL